MRKERRAAWGRVVQVNGLSCLALENPVISAIVGSVVSSQCRPNLIRMAVDIKRNV